MTYFVPGMWVFVPWWRVCHLQPPFFELGNTFLRDTRRSFLAWGSLSSVTNLTRRLKWFGIREGSTTWKTQGMEYLYSFGIHIHMNTTCLPMEVQHKSENTKAFVVWVTTIKYLGVSLVIRSMNDLLQNTFKRSLPWLSINPFLHEYPILKNIGRMNKILDKCSPYQSPTLQN